MSAHILLDSSHGLNNGPIDNQALFKHLNTEPVSCLDSHCCDKFNFFISISVTLSIQFSCSTHSLIIGGIPPPGRVVIFYFVPFRNTPVPSKMPRMSLSNLKSQRQMGSQSSISPGGMGTPSSRTSYRQNDLDSGSDSGGINSFLQRTALYIFGDKSQIRGIKLDAHPKAELIPVEFPDYRQTRNSFKKLVRSLQD